MEPAIARVPPPVAFRDGLGDRHHTVSPANEPLEVLALRKELTTVPAFEFALRERVSRLAAFRHACYAPIRGVSRMDTDASTLALVSDRVLGDRLADILALADRELIPLEIGASLAVLRQLIDAVAILHETVRDVCHGAIAPERIIITPDARLVMVEHVLGAALGSLQLSREQYWKDMRIALPPCEGAPLFDRRADVTQIGVIAVALLLGRPLREEEYPGRITEIAGRIGAVSAAGGLEPLPGAVNAWLARALQLDPRSSFASATEMRDELDRVLTDIGHTSSSAALKAFLAQYRACAARQPIEAEAPPPTASNPPGVAPGAAAAGFAARPATSPKAASKPEPKSRAPKPQEPAPVAMRNMFQHAEAPAAVSSHPSSRKRVLAAAVVLVALVSGGTLAARYLMADPAPVTTGTLVINSDPAGASVVVDGRARGTTPVTASLEPGSHVVEISSRGQRRTIPVSIAAGGTVSHFVELPKTPSGAGELQVRTEPAGARVIVDGQQYGVSPVTVKDLAPGTHVVRLENDLGALEETVAIEPGASASLVVPLKALEGAVVSGWITVSAPADVQVFENKSLLGSSRMDRIMMPAGRHDLEIVNEALGYRTTRAVTVAPGQVASLKLEWPRGLLAVNALPWAEVWIDGERVGETPMGNVTVPIGTHEVVFRHPELGEQRHQATVTALAPARLSVDLRKK